MVLGMVEAHTQAGCACACGPAATEKADTFENDTDAATAGIPTAYADAPRTAVDGKDRLTADEGTETQRAPAPETLVTPPVAHGGSLVGGVEISGLATEVQSTVSGGQGQGSIDTPTRVDAPREQHIKQHMARDTGMAEDSRVREHLKLGITFEMCKKVLLEIGVLLGEYLGVGRKSSLRWCDGKRYELTQLRSSYLDQDRWIAKAYPKRLTGYDVAAATRAYNSKQVEQMRSWCERKLSLNEVERVRHKKVWHETRSVGPADVFISHTQADHPSTVMAAMEAANANDGYLSTGDGFLKDRAGLKLRGVKRGTPLHFWVDLFSLRQSTTDFDLDEVLHLIKDVGLTLAIISKAEDAKDMYFARSFCLVEAYGTLVSKAEFVVLVLKSEGDRDQVVAEGSDELGYDLAVNSRAAHCRDAKAGELIKQFIEHRIGFEMFDRLLLAGAEQSFTRVAIMRHGDKCCNLGRFCAPSLSRIDHCCKSFDHLLLDLQVDPRFPDCMGSAFSCIQDNIRVTSPGRDCLMGDASFRMGTCCEDSEAYEYGGCCCNCCCRCCELLIVVGCCDGCCVWNGLSQCVAALCCFFLCCPTQYQDEDVRTLGELCERCAQCCSPMHVEDLLRVDRCVDKLRCGEGCQRRIFGYGAESWCEVCSSEDSELY